MRREVVPVAAALVFLLTGALLLFADAAQPVRFILTVALVFGIATLAAALAVAGVVGGGRGG